MTEKILTTKKNGMVMLLLLLALIVVSIAGIVLTATLSGSVLVLGLCMAFFIALLIVSLVCLGGLKVLKPQEALVLTLFGEYLGTIKGEGFYFVNPLATAVNPAAHTMLNQSGDVKSGLAPKSEEEGKRMSLKIMTLSNNKQKINDYLGNPVEIGIAVMWRVVDTAKAAFNVENYKAFLSLQCDSALRNIVRLYPYDAAPGVDTTGDGVADDGSLRGSSEIVANRIKEEIQSRVGEGFYFVNPLATAVNPAAHTMLNQSGDVKSGLAPKSEEEGKRMSLKIMTLSNNKQKINDYLGNPVEIGIAVMWRVVDTAKAAFNVENYKAFLSLQCDSALRNIVRLYPYDAAPGVDTTGDGVADDGSLRGSSEIVANRIKEEIQSRVEEAGLEIVDARITYLAYAPEIAAAMLQRQQASAVVDARKLIVDGAVGMVEMALERLKENGVVELDEERKAAMVSNLLVVLCGNKEAQPIVNSGSLY